MLQKIITMSFALLISICVITSSFACSVYAAENDETNVNKNLLEDMLNNRSWVIDTLINDDFSTNPYAKINNIANEKSMMATVLSQYGNENDPNYSAAYKTMVDALYVWYNAGDYTKDIADCVTEWTADVLEFFGGSDNAISALRRCADNAKTMQYDNILQEVLKADYTSSTGQTLSGSNSQLVQLRKIQDGVEMLKSFASASKSLAGLDDGTADTAAAYADSVLIPAADAYQDVMNNVAELTGSDMDERGQVLLDLTTSLGMVAVYDSIVISENNSGGAMTIAPAYLLDEETKKIIDINADIAKFADITIDSYMYVSSIQTQKESVAGVLNRTAEHLANAQTIDLLNRYSDLIKDAADGKTSNYDLILTSIRNSGYIEKYTESKISDALKKLKNRFIPCYDQSIIPGAFASATGVIGTATYLADAVTGLENTCTKTVELKNLNQLIIFFKATYERDLANYKANPTDENAAKVIDDLDFIQRLRLRGETIAYNMSKNQLDSYLGKLLAGNSDDSLADYYDYDYQKRLDAILGASVTPFTTNDLTVNKGETLSVYYDDNYGGLYAVYTKSNGNIYGIGDLNFKIINGINIASGGKLILTDNISFFIPIVKNDGDFIYGGNVKISELHNNGNITIYGIEKTIDYLRFEKGTIQLRTNLHIKNDFIQRGTLELNGCTLTVDGVYALPGILKMQNENDYILVNGRFEQSGTSEYITAGTLEIKGDMYSCGGYQPSGSHKTILSGSAMQNIDMYSHSYSGQYGHFNILELSNTSNEGITFECQANIYQELSSNGGKVVNGKYIYIKNNTKIRENVLNIDVTLCDWTDSSNIAFYGTTYLQGIISFNYPHTIRNISGSSTDYSIIVANDLYIENDFIQRGTLELNGCTLTVDGVYALPGILKMQNENDYILVNGRFEQSGTSEYITAGTLEIKGDMYSCGGYQPSGSHKTILSGNAMQNIDMYSHSYSGQYGHFNILEIKNISDEGVNFVDKAYVYGELYSDVSSKITNGINLCISKNAAIRELWNGDLSAAEWICNQDCSINGNLKIDYNINYHSTTVLNADVKVSGNVEISPYNYATLKIESAKLEIGKDFINQGILYMTNDSGYITINGMFVQKGTSEYITAGTLEIKGHIYECGKYQPTGTHKTILSGENAQNIDLYYNSNQGYFNILEIKNISDEGVNFVDKAYVYGELYSDVSSKITNGINLCISKNATIRELWNGDLSAAEWICNQDCSINGNLKIDYDINYHSTTVLNADVKVSGNVEISPYNYATLKIESAKLEIGKHFINQGILLMTNGKGYIAINGDCNGFMSTETQLTAGTIDIRGNMLDCGRYRPTGTHTTILSGNIEQSIDLLNSSYQGHFNVLKIMNTSKNGVNFIDNTNVLSSIYQPVGTKIINSNNVKLQNKTAFIDYGELNLKINAYNDNAENVVPTWLDYKKYCEFVLDGNQVFTLNETITDVTFACDLYFSTDYDKPSATAIIAFYDENNRLVQMKSETVDVAPGKIDFSIEFEDKDYSKYKVMIWESFSTLRPLADVK